MTKNTIIALLIGIIIGGVVVGLYERSVTGTPDIVVYESTRGMGMSPGTGGHMAHMEQMMVTSERTFIEQMIPHHQEAIDTANEVLERGGTTEAVRELMERIVEAQTAEIELMRGWYEAWYGEAYVDNKSYEPMMRDLSGLYGTALDRAFLEDMVPHHMGAIMMARSVQPYIEHEELTELTAAIIATQSAEMVEMRELLGELQSVQLGE
jgi:uncharacterized protein (DUF305 family)